MMEAVVHIEPRKMFFPSRRAKLIRLNLLTHMPSNSNILKTVRVNGTFTSTFNDTNFNRVYTCDYWYVKFMEIF